MHAHVIETAFEPAVPDLLKRLGLEADSDEAEEFIALLENVAPLAAPVAAVMEAEAAVSGADRIRLGGVEFTSALLADNLRDERVAWPYLATCGRRIYDYAMAMADPFERYWVDEIMQAALDAAMTGLNSFVGERLFPGKTASMAPGSLIEWPIQQQIPLFRLLGDAPERCGVTLTDSLLMLPNKSVSGIIFHNEHGYVSCRLCPREQCPNRRAAFEPRTQMS